MLPATWNGRKDMVKIGDVCPLFFDPPGKGAFGVEDDYIQKFHTDDIIRLQVLADGGESVAANLNDKVRGLSSPISFSTYIQTENVTLYYTSISLLADSVYTVSVDGVGESEPFCVSSSDSLLEDTTLIRYSHKDNNSAFDNLFWIEDAQQFFEFRVEAGIKPEGYMPQVSNEQYRNQFQEIVELYAVPYDQWQLTVGNASGVPVWFIRLINRILCLSHVEIGGNLYVRSEQSVPEKTQTLEDRPLFQATVLIEPLENEVSGIGGMPEPGSAQSVVGFAIENPKDGQMLQYQEDKDAFVNVTTVEV